MADPDVIIKELEKSLRENPDNIDTRIELANNYMMRGDYYNAAAELQKVVKNTPPAKTYIDAYYQLGIVLRTLGNFTEAKKCMEKVLEVEQDNGNALYYLGLILGELGDYTQAAEALRKSIGLLSPQSYIYYALGNTELQLGNIENAIAEFKKALAISPGDVHVKINLGLAYLMKKSYKDASRELSESVQLNPKDAMGIFLLAWANMKREKEVEALELIEKFVGENSTHSIGFLVKSALHYLMEEYEEGSESCKNGLKLFNALKDPVFYSAIQVITTSITEISEEKEIMEEEEAEFKKNIMHSFQEIMGIKDKLLRDKSRILSSLAKAIAEASGELEEGEVEDLEIAGALCNLGMSLMPDMIVNKEDKLSDDEKKILATHPLVTARVLEKINAIAHLVPYIKHHHERWNGTGYPDHLKGDDIPLEASILGISDFFTELTMGSKRQKPVSKQEAINAINTLKDNFFSKKMIDLFNAAVVKI